MKVRVSVKGVLEYLLAILLILSSNSIYNARYSSLITISVCMVAGILIVLGLFRKHRRNVVRRLSVFFPFYYIYISITALMIAEESWSKFMYRFGIILPIMILFFSLQQENARWEFWEICSKCIVVIAFLATIVWLLGPILHMLESSGTVIVQWGGLRKYVNYFGIVFTTKSQARYIGGHIVPRGMAFYTEVPMYNFVILFGLMVELFVRERKNKWCLAVYAAAIVSTFSVTSYVLGTILVCISLIQKSSKRSRQIMIRILMIGVGLAVVGLVTWFSLRNKLAYDTANARTHLSAIGNGMGVFMNHLLSGTGYRNKTIYTQRTSGLFVVLAQGGIVWGMVYMVPFVVWLRAFCKRKDMRCLMFGGVIAVLFMLILIQEITLFLGIIGFGYSLMVKE